MTYHHFRGLGAEFDSDLDVLLSSYDDVSLEAGKYHQLAVLESAKVLKRNISVIRSMKEEHLPV